jgi:hypothetical protein
MKHLIRKLRCIFGKWAQPKYKTEYHDDIPACIMKNIVYVIGERIEPWCVMLKCPCGCTKDIQLNLLKEGDPRWRLVKSEKKGITISPSIWRTTRCQSHFHIRNGRIYWVNTFVSLKTG